MIGKLNRKEYLAQATLSNPRKIPVEIVEPDLDMPGIDAMPCARPMIIAVFKSTLSVFVCFFSAAHSPRYKIQPVKNIKIPTIYVKILFTLFLFYVSTKMILA